MIHLSLAVFLDESLDAIADATINANEVSFLTNGVPNRI